MARISEQDAQDHYSSNYNGEWFQLKNHGDVARIQFLHDTLDDLPIFSVHKVMVGDKERYVDCIRTYDEPIDNCPLCAAGHVVKPVRFVIMFDHADEKVKIWERGKQFIAKIQGLMNRYNPLSEYVFEIERNGKAGDKETKYEIFPMDRVDPKDLSQVEPVELLGGLILEKDFDEMCTYVETGNFPATAEDEAPATPQTTPRRAQANNPQPQSRTGNSATSRAAAPNNSGVSRRAAAPQQNTPQRSRRATGDKF